MRAHALVLLLVLGLALPPAPSAGAQTPAASDALFSQGVQLMHRGDFPSAQQFYADLAGRLSSDLAPRALLYQARAALADGDTEASEAVLQQLLATYPSSDQAANAYFALEQTRRAAGDCAGALRALDAYEATVGGIALGPYTWVQRAQCSAKLRDWPGELDAAKTALAIDGGGPRLTRIEALERAGEANLNMGRRQEALDFYDRSMALAGTPAYRAEMLFTTATLMRALGQTNDAVDRFRSVVVDYPDQARAPGALDALIDMGRGDVLSLYQAGVVRLDAKQYSSAAGLFDQVDPANADWAAAQRSRAEALLKLGHEDAARQALESVADGSALLRLGQLDESDSDPAAAESNYFAMLQAAPDRAAEAMFHIGFTRYIRGDTAGALSAWQQGLGSGPPAPAMQSQLEYWISKALPAGSPEAAAFLNQAATADPESFYASRAQRAQDVVSSGLGIAGTSSTTAKTLSAASAKEQQQTADWYADFLTTPERAASDVAAEPSLARAVQLLDLGLRTEASWEIEGLMQQYVQAQDYAHLAALADWLTAHDLPQSTLLVGKQERDLLGYTNLPRSLQKQVYPAGWGDLVQEQAGQYGVDPLLMLAMIRQESSFDPRAQSGAQAMGLTQVVPSTARMIAAKLGRDDFSTHDLFKPAVSLAFGSWFVSQLLGDYKGGVIPTLAAYNAGGGNVARWLNRFGNDPDVLVEEIPLPETQMYVRIVYDNYVHYQLLYGDQSA
ncbi:MAG: transglycosylase SLT domain-containing protein [Chloroflexi bacterium]|nr:transglycosylase SLT domain-containing protein [Chloroflexota bacterium]